MEATILAFPTKRKRPYLGGFVRRDQLPDNVTALPWPESPPVVGLHRTPELALILALVSAMTKNDLTDDPLPTKVALLSELQKATARSDCPCLAAALSFAERL